MRQADIPLRQVQLFGQRPGLAVQNEPWAAPLIVCANLNLDPADIAYAGAERLGHGFFGGKTRRKTLRIIGAIGAFAGGEKSA